MRFPLPENEADRLSALRSFEIVGSAPDPGFDAICRAAKHLFGVPVALVSLVEEDHQWFKARCGFDWQGTSREVSFCTHAILGDEVFVVEDARLDPRFADNPLVEGTPFIRFYAGAPLVVEPGLRIGTLCLIDTRARRLEEDDRDALRDLAQCVIEQIRLHQARLAATNEAEERGRSERLIADQRTAIAQGKAHLQTTLDNIDQGILMVDGTGVVQVYNERVCKLLDLPEALLAARPTIAEVVDYQSAAGDFAGADETLVAMIRRAGLDGRSGVYERRRRNGRVLEVRFTGLGEGGSVRTYTDVTEARRVLAELRDNEERLSLALDATRDGVWDIDLETGIRVASGPCYEYLDLPPGETRLSDTFAIMHEKDRERVRKELDRHLRGETDLLVVEYRLRLRQGGYMWVLDRGRVVKRDETGRALRILGTQTDITERKRSEEAMRILNERLELALTASGLGLWDWDLRTQHVWRCRRWHELLGHEAGLPGDVETWRSRIHPEDLDQVVRNLEAHLRGETAAIEHEYRMRHEDGRYRWIASKACVVDWDDGKPVRILGVHADITKRKEEECREARMARHDPLTDLPNRLLLNERLEQALAHAERHGGEIGILCLDLDRFKSVNDTLGHAGGDTVLVEVARRLRDLVRREDTVARLGGDEFVILQVGAPGDVDCETLARRIVRALSQPIALPEREVCIGTSIGIARAPRDATSPRDLLIRADTALYRAKVNRNTYRFFEPAMDHQIAERRALELDLRRAIERGELVLHYQPIQDLRTREVVAREALVRWRHPNRGLLYPAEFVSVAEEIGMISEIGQFVLDTACRDANQWPSSCRAAVNVSAMQFRQADFAERVVTALETSGLPPDRLELEITETAIMEDSEETSTTFARLRDLGTRIALDDFGTGYSSLGKLARYAFDKIKIDRSFIRDLDNVDNVAIVRAVAELGLRRGCEIVAEGIETEEQCEAARMLGCTQGQGFFIGRPAAVGKP